MSGNCNFNYRMIELEGARKAIRSNSCLILSAQPTSQGCCCGDKMEEEEDFAEIMLKIEEYISKQPKASEDIIHKFIRDKYSKRFPELESLVPNALDYIRTVKELGNSLDKCKNNENLQQILTNATIMVVSVTASTTQGQQLTEEELERIEEACDMALELNQSKHRIYEYVESRMSFIAPNLSIIDLRRKAARLVSAKCTLAARVDSFHESPEGKVGYDLKEEIERKFDKWQEPPPVKQIEEDAYQEDLGFSLGHLGKSGSGRVRQTQGLEIVNPQAAEKKVAEANQKYFSSMAEFLKVKNEKSGVLTNS
ncbi:U4/U6 small nuclear ribonucleoprotein Prp31 [Varanus komodoensis]|nr:U4/U6 small nuclear ribonucleoprotein Prp31 [Varanus komodoensis]